MVDISNRGIVGFNGESGRDTKDDIICQSKKSGVPSIVMALHITYSWFLTVKYSV